LLHRPARAPATQPDAVDVGNLPQVDDDLQVPFRDLVDRGQQILRLIFPN
jgi:hypothetical protein